MQKLEGNFYFYKGFILQITDSGFCRIAKPCVSVGFSLLNGNLEDKSQKMVDRIIEKEKRKREIQEEVVNKALNSLSQSLVNYLDKKASEFKID